ncbi:MULTISPECIES: CvpA family protein [unclassified Aureimonas]|uniref:CvpA family protein n=1 Tax=unclassified Aureimonas TaxID=2615206 RepID=UPI0006F7A279|nr:MULTISPECIES: CvpA family protein [unclassified Aureimonas]KQT52911.1 colicin V synthesis protein [Aureimonas sp. Leaf427]KQT80370.1 colicin V synthesis protein [Aureimonas sp. Leaf460]
MTVTLLDAILVGIMLVSALLAMVRGFSREVLSVLSWLAAAAAAFFFYKQLTPYVKQYVESDTVAMGLSGLAIFFLTLIIVSFITLRIADFIIDSRIGALDRTLGFVFGAARGLALVVVAMLFFNWLAPENQPTWIAEARSKPFLDDLGARLVAAVPERPEELLPEQIREKLDRQPAAEPSTIEGAIEGAAPSDTGAADAPDEAPAN